MEEENIGEAVAVVTVHRLLGVFTTEEPDGNQS
jgi:hypothetical protein